MSLYTQNGKGKPQIRRVVTYMTHGSKDGKYKAIGVPAIITSVDDLGSRKKVGLCILNPTGMFFNVDVLEDSDNYTPGTWNWDYTGDQPEFELIREHGRFVEIVDDKGDGSLNGKMGIIITPGSSGNYSQFGLHMIESKTETLMPLIQKDKLIRPYVTYRDKTDTTKALGYSLFTLKPLALLD